MRKVLPDEIKQWLKEDTTKFVLEKLAQEMNRIDTIRNIKPDNITEHLAGRMAIEIIENWLGEIWEAGELEKIQKEAKTEEERIIKSLQELKQEY